MMGTSSHQSTLATPLRYYATTGDQKRILQANMHDGNELPSERLPTTSVLQRNNSCVALRVGCAAEGMNEGHGGPKPEPCQQFRSLSQTWFTTCARHRTTPELP